MNKPDAAFAPPAAAHSAMRGVPLSMAGAPAGASAIGLEMLPAGHGSQLHGVADNLGAGWLDRRNGRLRLQFHVVAIFGNAPVEGFWLAMPGGAEKLALPAARIASPAAGAHFTNLPWAAQSRYVVDQTVDVGAWPDLAGGGELYANVAGKMEKIGIIHAAPQPVAETARAAMPAEPESAPKRASAPSGQAERTVALSVQERLRRLNPLLLLTVIVPTLIASVYYGLIASDVYISQSKFIVRGAQQQPFSPLTMLFKGADFGRSQDDSYSVQEFILSRDALRKLDADMGLGRDFGSKNVDIFSRFPGLDWDDSFEALYKYYQKKVDVQIDSASSIVTLTTRAFTANDAVRANQLLLGMSEALVNQLNDQGRQDMIRFAEREVSDAEKRDQQATMALARVQTGGAASFAKGRSLAGKFSEYQRLALEKDYSDKLLASALSSLQEARDQAMRKQLYVERIAQPSTPDRAMEPRRLRSVAAVFVLGLVAWGVLTLLLAGVREHMDMG